MKIHGVRGIFAAVVLVFLLTACAVTPPQVILPSGTLTRAEVLVLFHDRTVESVTLNRGRVSVSYYSPTGKVFQVRNKQKRQGFWRVNDEGRICLQMEEESESCRIIVREADGRFVKYIVKKNGQHQPSVGYRKFTNGNPGNL